MIISTGKQLILLGVLATTPVIWYKVNELDRLLELIRLGDYQELLKLIKQPERFLRFCFSSGIAGFVGGASYLCLPLKMFIGWIPFVGRVDDFIAKSFVSGGLCALALGFAIQTQIR